MNEPYVHPKALVESNIANIGLRTRIWAFAHVSDGVIIGEDCNICDNVYLETGVQIGNRVTIKNGVCLWGGTKIEDDVFIGPNAVFTDDKYPRSKVKAILRPSYIKQGATIGANATILPGITIGKYAMVGAGTVVTKNVEDFQVIIGNPGKSKGYGCKCGNTLTFVDPYLYRCYKCNKEYTRTYENYSYHMTDPDEI